VKLLRGPRVAAALLLLLGLALVGCQSDIYEVRWSQPIILETTRTERILVDIRNISGFDPFPLEEKVEAALREKGYTLVGLTEADKADVVLRVRVLYVGLERPDYTGERAVSGGLLGAGAGALGGAATRSGGRGVALGALIGAATGAGAGALQEKMAQKEVFTGSVVVQIRQKGKDYEAVSRARVREKDLTYERAIEKVADSIARQIAGLF